jgi:hypothetical protein
MSEIGTTTIEAIEEEAKKIQKYLEKKASDDPTELLERLSTINAHMARSGYMLAQCQRIKDEASASLYTRDIKLITKMPATVANRYVEAMTARESYLLKWLDRINRTCVHQSDNIRTQVSYLKQQMELEERAPQPR